jgi:thioredoxin reductase
VLYDCIIIGGGIAGLQAAIQLGRYQYNVLVLDANNGRSTLCRCYHNLLGWPEGVSGETLRRLGKQQAEQLQVTFQEQLVEKVEKINNTFCAYTHSSQTFQAKRLLLATGVKDNFPPFPELLPCLGISVYVCPDCDGYEVLDKPAVVLGSGNAGADMAAALSHWSKQITFINHNKEKLDSSKEEKLRKKDIHIINSKIVNIHATESNITGVTLENGDYLQSSHAFLAFGGNQVNTSLAAQLGVQLQENKHIVVDPRTKMTNVLNVWAAGDIAAHSEQVAIAMGDGVQAAIWIHKSLQDDS